MQNEEVSTKTKRTSAKALHEQILKLTIAALMAALCYLGYTYIPTPALNDAGTKIHIGNVFVVLGALLLGPYYGGLAGAVGLSIADITSSYAASAPRTFITKLVIGLIVGFIAVKLKKINEDGHNTKYILIWSAVATIAALGFNCVFEPSLKWLWYTLLFPDPSKSQSAIKTLVALTAGTSFINAILNSAISIFLYNALRPALKKASVI
ncbi:MAG: ECF transporter S component [Lachnospiraceae bacterium]|nr:ECF transporter S component [Lachnospiraceae bacterium]